MGNQFGQAKHSLKSDSGRTSTVTIGTACILIAAWGAWASLARVTRYEMSDSARLEIDSAVYSIQTAAAGRLTAVHMRLGQTVRAGDVLLEFDNRTERFALDEQRSRLSAMTPQLTALRAEMEAENAGRTDERKVLQTSQSGAQAQLTQAVAEASLADEEATRAEQMRVQKLISEADAAKARANARSKRAAAENMQAAASRLEPELDVRQRDRDIKTKQTLVDISKLEGEIATAAATVRKLEYDSERRQLRAPVSRRLAECIPLQPGAHLVEGERVGLILPEGKLQVIAQFQPSAALGKVHAGQNAVLRLQGFPWAQYGVVPARVSRVADEIRDGRVRVELAVNTNTPSPIPAQHGLPGSIEVEIERVSPALLILRSAGEWVGSR